MAVADLKVEDIKTDSVARGAVYMMAAQFVLLIAGYLMHAYLGRTLGPANYGAFGVVMALLVWFEVSLTGAFPYAIRKFGAENRDQMPQIASTALKGQFIYSCVIFAAVEACAPWIASALGDSSLTPLIRVASLDIPVYAAYFCYLGVLNGYGIFSKQSISVMIYSGSKLIAVTCLVAMGVGVKGAFIGNAAASVLGFAAARILAGSVSSRECYPMKKMIGFVAGTASLAVIFTFLISLDIFLVKALVRNKEMIGLYIAAATLAKAPFFLFLAISNVTLPSVSRALAGDDSELVKTYVGQSFRLHLMLLLPLTAIVSSASSGIISFIYRSSYEGASVTLSILITAFMFWGLLNGVYNLMLARHQTIYPVVSTLVLIALMAVLCWWLIPQRGIAGAAVSAVITGIIGLLAAGIIAYREFGTIIKLASLVRITFASVIAYMTAGLVRVGGPAVMGLMAGAFAIYVFALIISGEVTRNDLGRVTAMGSRK